MFQLFARKPKTTSKPKTNIVVYDIPDDGKDGSAAVQGSEVAI